MSFSDSDLTTFAEINNLIFSATLHDLSTFLDRSIEHASPEELRIINRTLSEPSTLNLLINRIINKPYFFEKVTNKSYCHENGFHKIVLLAGTHFKLRLHHFGVGAKIPMENIHDHRWPFASTILLGNLYMDYFEVSNEYEGSEEVFHFIYTAAKRNNRYSTELIGKTLMKKSRSVAHKTGDCYLMRTEDLHRITNEPGAESITLILTGKPQSDQCNLYAKREILEEEKQILKYNADELKSMLSIIREKIYPQKN